MGGPGDFEAEELLAGGTTAPVTRVDAKVRLVSVQDSPARRELQERARMLIGLKLTGVGQDVLQRYCSAALASAAEVQLASEPGTASDLPAHLARLCAWLTGTARPATFPRVVRHA